jgi:SAM-dependent methyltransferase
MNGKRQGHAPAGRLSRRQIVEQLWSRAGATDGNTSTPVAAGPVAFWRVARGRTRHDVVCSREAVIANMLSVSSIAHQPDEDWGRPRGEAARAHAAGRCAAAPVEPDERMRAVHGGAVAGSAEAIPLDDASVDAVFVGEAFHWFDPAAAIPDLARVLRPGGGLAIISTHWWETEPPLPDAALEALSEPGSGSVRSAGRRGTMPSPGRRSGCSTTSGQTTSKQSTSKGSPSTPRRAPSPRSLATSAPRCSRRVRPLLAGPYRLPLRHELTWTRLPR